MSPTLRNVLVVLALAAAVAAIPAVGFAAALFAALLSLALLAGLAWFAVRLYREHRVSLFGLGDRQRGILYGAVGLAVLTLAAQPRLWATPGGVVVWFALIGAASYAVYAVYRASREY